MSERVFAYGSNMCLGRFLKYRVHPEAPRIPARLPGYSLRFNKESSDGSGKANVEQHGGDEVWGVLYTIPDADLNLLDEGEKGYCRLLVPVQTETGPVEAWVYFATPSQNTELRPYFWSRGFLSKVLAPTICLQTTSPSWKRLKRSRIRTLVAIGTSEASGAEM